MKLKKLLSLIIISSFTVLGCSKDAEKEMYIVSYPTVTTFNVGEAFTSEGLSLMDLNSYEDITKYSLTYKEGYIFKKGDAGNQKVTISKSGYKSISYPITVTNYPALEIGGTPITEFNVNDYFSTEGLIVTCDGEVITDYTTSFSTHNRLTQAGTFDVVVSKEGYFRAAYQIKVYPEKELFIKHAPDTTRYTVGDAFSSQGLVVMNERRETVTDYELSIAEGTILNVTGMIDVTVSKDSYISTNFTISINPPSGGEVTYRDLTIYYLNDTHGSYSRNEDLNEGGMAYISSYIKDKREDDPDNTIVLSGGDMFQGGYESNETHGQIMIDAMNEIGFDAMVFGNHEMDWGEEYIQTFADGLDCDIISANTFYSIDNESRPEWVKPYHIVEKNNLRIGIIGGAEFDMGSHVIGSVSNNFYFPKANSYIKQYSTLLRLNHQCDIIIAAFHDAGFEGYTGSPTQFADLTEIDSATNRKYVDAMFFAHDHLRKSGTYNGVPYLEAGCNGINIGELTFNIKITGTYSEIINTSTDIKWATTVCKTYDPAFEAIDNRYQYIFEKGEEEVYNFKNAYDSDTFTDVACASMLWYVNSHPTEFNNTTVSMASHNAGGIRSDVSKGIMKYKDFVKVFPFDNFLCIQRCSQSNISNYLNCDYYHTVGTAVYENDGYARVASINYITESTYAYRYQRDYVKYNITVKTILYNYLKNNINPNL